MPGEDPPRNNRRSGVAGDATGINVLMMRFRPIAPKPPDTGEPSHSLPGTTGLHLPAKALTKRKYRRARRQGRGSAGAGCQVAGRANLLEHREEEITGETRTLQLIADHGPEESSQSVKASEGELDSFWHPTAGGGSGRRSGFLVKSKGEDERTGRTPPSCLVILQSPLPDLNNVAFPSASSDPLLVGTSMVPRKKVLDVCLIVESVVMDESCIQVVEQLLGHTDEERLTGLVAEECPGFVSDADNQVRWANGAFERMIMAELASCGGRGEVAVRLAAAEEDLSACSRQAFTSRVRIQYTWRDDSCPEWWGPRLVMVAPCDAWRLYSGGFAWRLDVNAALSLGRR